MVDEIFFKNYKIFKSRQHLKLRPITILLGKNNTGKSAILKLMSLLDGALDNPKDKLFELSNEDVVFAKEYTDLIYGGFSSRPSEFELREKQFKTFFKVSFVIDTDKNIPVTELWNYNNQSKYERNVDGTYRFGFDNYPCYFKGFREVAINAVHDKEELGILPPSFSMNTDFIGAIRENIRNYYEPINKISEKSGIDGRYLYDFLIQDYLTSDKRYFSKINDWLRTNFEGWELHIVTDQKPYHLFLRNNVISVKLRDTGMGIAQSLPLIIRAFKPCEKESLIVIEEPECHLHPFAHAQMAELFYDSTQSDKNKRYLIETHSQNFILRLRRLVAEGKMRPEDLGLYYVDYNEEKNESELKEIKVDKGGGVEFWPDNVFGETSLETRAIYNAQQNDLRNVGGNN